MIGSLKTGLGMFFVAAALAASCGAGFADESAPQQSAKPVPSGTTCIWKRDLKSGYFSVIDQSHVILEGVDHKYYLLSLYMRCFNLDRTLALGYTSVGDQLCAPGDSLLVEGDRCAISSIENVASEAEAKSIVAGREAAEKAARDAKKNKPPAPASSGSGN